MNEETKELVLDLWKRGFALEEISEQLDIEETKVFEFLEEEGEL